MKLLSDELSAVNDAPSGSRKRVSAEKKRCLRKLVIICPLMKRAALPEKEIFVQKHVWHISHFLTHPFVCDRHRPQNLRSQDACLCKSMPRFPARSIASFALHYGIHHQTFNTFVFHTFMLHIFTFQHFFISRHPGSHKRQALYH